MRQGKTLRRYVLRYSPYKKIVKTLRYKRGMYTARACLMVPEVKEEALQQILTAVRVECNHLCQKNPRPSILRNGSTKELKAFSWKKVILELQRKAPTFLAVLQAAAQPRRRRLLSLARNSSKKNLQPRGAARDSTLVTAAAVLLKERCQPMSKVQTIVGTLLYAGHAAKKVRYSLNPLPTNDAPMRHDLCELSISLWKFIWGFNTRRYTSVHGFCFF